MYTFKITLGFITVTNANWWCLLWILCWVSCETISGPCWTGKWSGRQGRVVESGGPVCPTGTPDTFLILLLPLSLLHLCFPSSTLSILVLPSTHSPSFPLIYPQPARIPDWFHLHPQQLSMLMSPSSSIFLWSLPRSIRARWDASFHPHGTHKAFISKHSNYLLTHPSLLLGFERTRLGLIDLSRPASGTQWEIDKCLLNERMI